MIAVEFVDATSGVVFARADLPPEQLPADFSLRTTLQLGGEPWLVETASRPAPGRLVLTVRRIERVAPQALLFSLPTLCEALPPLAPGPVPGGCLELHEDDWRQVEAATPAATTVVETEFAAIRRVYERHREPAGFRDLHARTVGPLIPRLPWNVLGPAEHEYAGVCFRGATRPVAGGFAVRVRGVTWYGLRDADQITLLAVAGPVTPAAGAVLSWAGLALVDWCRCEWIR
ncbi:hypothetical protein KZZ52_31035 [Dactylosporangium sp. AC04546]|uniref:hypothetical protein n=1 Tax=Dactylosporangium sp. AC04546 TaxID=2862460 RepID=UPI001EE101E2|nr:hypothetical protein [Dactylosporangium sp. AC04546]WVK78429.1 hypothetical protein KZZ52_31035 [Dactylosporangium sp. AC04546]